MEIYVFGYITYMQVLNSELQDVAATLAATLYIRYLGPIERTE